MKLNDKILSSPKFQNNKHDKNDISHFSLTIPFVFAYYHSLALTVDAPLIMNVNERTLITFVCIKMLRILIYSVMCD